MEESQDGGEAQDARVAKVGVDLDLAADVRLCPLVPDFLLVWDLQSADEA
ncbi:hypothetical protein IMZ48_50010 [Candidatus Bathyarchaeota archaeon]|nr:hypothetical protein [Candidatus Bathyarchaeota archaeon]